MQRIPAPPKALRLPLIARARGRSATIALAAAGALAAALAGQVEATAAAGAVLLAAVLVTTGTLQERDVFNPAVVAAVFVGVLTLGRVAYVVDHGSFGLDQRDLLPLAGNERDFALGVLAQFGAAALFVAGAARARRWRLPAAGRSEKIDQLPLAIALVVVGVLASATLASAVREAGGVSGYVDLALGNRQTFFDDRGWMLLFLTMLPGLALAWLAINVGELRSGNRRAIALVIALVAAVAATATGSRGLLLFMFAAPALAIVHVRVRRIRLWVALAALLVAFLGAGAYREVVRSTDAPDGIYETGAKGVLVNTFASPDSQLPDPVAILLTRDPRPKLGSTVASAVAAPVPRRIWPGKPTGANEQFTRWVAPERFRLNKTEYAITLAGEMLWNFWWLGLAAFAVLGFAAGAAYRWAVARSRDPIAVFAFSSALGIVLLLLRGDVFNTAITTGQFSVPALGLLVLGRRLATA